MKSLLSTVLFAGLFLVSAGCTPRPSTDDARLRDLEAENAALRAQRQAVQQPATPRDTPKRTPPQIDPAKRTKLEQAGVKVTESGEALTFTLPGKVLFDSGSASLRPAAKHALDQSAGTIKSDIPDAQVVVQGHTDNQPISRTKNQWKSNEELSMARATAVANHLKKAGVKPGNVTAQGFGPSKPIADNKTKEGRALNRRVEIVLRLRTQD